MQIGKINFNANIAAKMIGIQWKTINKKFKNNYEKALESIFSDLEQQGIRRQEIDDEVDNIYKQVISSELEILRKRMPPPPR